MPSATRLFAICLLGFLAVATVAYGAPTSQQLQQQQLPQQQQQQNDDGVTLTEKLNALQRQIMEIQSAIQQAQQQQQGGQQLLQQFDEQPSMNRQQRSMAWQPMKRLVAWQPMKRSDASVQRYEQQQPMTDMQRDQLIRTIEQQLSEVLHAGETLGIGAEDVLAHLRAQRVDGIPQFQ